MPSVLPTNFFLYIYTFSKISGTILKYSKKILFAILQVVTSNEWLYFVFNSVKDIYLLDDTVILFGIISAGIIFP